MKWWSELRGVLRATGHGLAVLLPLLIALRVPSTPVRVVCALLALGGVALLVRAAFVYWPGFDPWGRVPWRGPRTQRRIAITFDDGPNGEATEGVLELFRRYGGKATFFFLGANVEAQPELARKVAAEGHVVGSHTYSHAKLSQVPLATAIDEVERGHRALLAAGLPDTKLFRAPHGLKTFGVVRHLDKLGLKMIAWTAGLYDTRGSAGEVIAQRALRWLRPGVILLLHDGKLGHDRRNMLTGLERILQVCRQRGLQPVTVPELLGLAR